MALQVISIYEIFCIFAHWIFGYLLHAIVFLFGLVVACSSGFRFMIVNDFVSRMTKF